MTHAHLVLATAAAACALGSCLDGGPSDSDSDVSCLALTPQRLDFGEVATGTLATATLRLGNCGAVPADIVETLLSGDPAFSMTTPAPARLGPGDAAHITLAFAPVSQGQATASLDARATDGGAVSAALVGSGGAPAPCETAIAVSPATQTVRPGATLNLSFTSSCGEEGTPRWSIAQPAGAQAVFEPSPASREPTIRLDVVGTYVIHLAAGRAEGTGATAVWTVEVKPESLYLIELTWETPGDPDPTDEGQQAGSDLDLHLTHPFAAQRDCPGGWYDATWDTAWFNRDPRWGSTPTAVEGSPKLVRDDQDGAGPETIAFQVPEEGLRYPIGVHVWDSYGYGPSYATVRVYVAGQLRFERTEGPLHDTDLWVVGTLDHGTRHVAPDGTICEGYTDPRFPREQPPD